MKIDFDMLKIAADGGVSPHGIIAMVKEQYDRGEKKRKRDKEGVILRRAGLGPRQQATKGDKERHEQTMNDDKERQKATLDDSPRARLFREGSEAMAALGRTGRGARAAIAAWLKATNDDAQLVLATILKARDLSVSDPAGWITATLNAKVKPNGSSQPHAQQSSGSLEGAIAEVRSRLRSRPDRTADVSVPESGLFGPSEIHGPIIDDFGAVPAGGGGIHNGPPDGHPAAFEMAPSNRGSR